MLPLADIKTSLGITDTSQDDYLTEQLAYYTAVIQLYTRRKLVRATYTDTFYRPETPAVQLSEYPVLSVTSLAVDETALAANTWEVEARVGRLWRGAQGGGSFCAARKVVCTYVAGYDPLSADLALVVMSLMRGAYEARVTGGVTAASTSAGSGDIKSVTAFGVMKVDYDTSASSSSSSSGSSASEALEDVLGNHVGILSRYVDHAKTLHTPTG